MPRKKRNSPKISKLLNFELVESSGGFLPEADDFVGLMSTNHKPRLLLEYYNIEMIEEALARYGVISKLKHKGYHNLKIHLDTSDANRQRLIICFDKFEYENLLAEVTLTTGRFMPKKRFHEKLCECDFKMLYIQWLWLQDPQKKFNRERPALPGQYHPGLGIGNLVLKVFEGLAHRLNFDGIINIPEYLHNAILYDRRFNFLDPVTQGKLNSLKKHLKKYTLAELSWGLELGCVVNAKTGKKFPGLHEEQVFPIAREFHDYFFSKFYLEQMKKAEAETEYTFDSAKFINSYPLQPDFSPKKPPEPRQDPLL